MRSGQDETEAVAGPPSRTQSTEAGLCTAVLERVSDAFVALDREGRYTFVNKQAAQVLGMRAESMLGQQIWKLFPEAQDGPFARAYMRAVASQDVAVLEDYNPLSDRWLEYRIYPSADGMSLFFHDISDRKLAEALLVGQSKLLELIANGASLSSVLDATLRFLEGQCRGMRSSILLLDPDGLRLRHGAAPSLPEAFTRAIDGAFIGQRAGSCGTAAFTGKPVISEDIASDDKWEDWRALALPMGLRACWSSPIFDDKRRVLGTFAMYYTEPKGPKPQHQRLTETATHIAAIAIARERANAAHKEQERIREKNKELEECNRAAQEASRLKSEFLANMSHELRTPLNAVIGFSEFLSDQAPGPLNLKQQECLDHVLTSGRHLLRLINDVLDLAKIEAGKVELFPIELCLPAELEEVCSVARALALEKRITVNLRCEAELERVTLDPQRLKQVLFNLLANAVKFTADGGRIDVVARALDDSRLEICVRDTGIGICQADLPKLFQEFRQLDSGSSRQHEGTGLGLVLAKRLVETQQGTISVESEPGVGSTFGVVLPRVLRVPVRLH